MTAQSWFFKKQPVGFRDRNPLQQNEFFASEAVGSLVSALVREGLQNSGDARSESTPPDQPVHVRMFVSGSKHALTPKAVEEWGAALWDHLDAENNGLRNPPKPSEPCQFLVFEDFGTSGLCGDTTSDDPDKNPFYCFFRAENASSKMANSGGSWGIGKTAFPRVSRANAFFAMSTRETDGRTVLMGSLTLRTRHIKKVKYAPDSWFGVPQEGLDDGGMIQPIEDPETIKAFKQKFLLTRKAGQNGTSIIVPWCDPSLTRDALAQATIESNFLPIIAGRLSVSIGNSPDPADDLVLNAETIEKAVEALPDGTKAGLLASVRLAKWAKEQGEAARVGARHEPAPKQSVKWDQYKLDDSDRDRLRSRFDAGHPISIRVPVPLRKHDKSERTSHLDIFLQRTPDGTTIKPVFVRGSVVIPDHQIKKVPGAVAIIQSARDELGNLLRAAEDPGHKEWSTETDNFHEFKNNVIYAKSYLTLAREAALRSHRLLQDLETEEDFDLLGDVFSLPKEPDEEGMKPGGKGKSRRKRPVIRIERPPQMVSVSQIDGGFTISRASPESPTPARIRLRAAFAVSSGRNPFNAWDAADFVLDKQPIKIERAEGLEVDKFDGNTMDMRITDPKFALSMTGFDIARGDLKLDVTPEGRLDETHT